MARNMLASLALAGILERPTGRSLRMSHRFQAHAEGTAGRLRTLGRHPDEEQVMAAALMTWDDHPLDPYGAARFLVKFLEDQHVGLLRPVFPNLEGFAACA